MNTEVEAKFVNVDHESIRDKLRAVGAELKTPMRLMKRVTINNEVLQSKRAFVRVRDEGDKTTITYKQFDDLSVDGAKEIEIEVSDFQSAVDLLDAAGLTHTSYQESKRETWQLGDVEIVLDEWPWLDPYIEVEGPSIEAVQTTSAQLGLQWEHAVFGDVMTAYRAQYPHLTANDLISRLPVVKFGDPLPDMFIA